MSSDREWIAEELLGCALQKGGFAPCPGKARHSKGDGARDFRVVLDGAPTGFCFHGGCSQDVADFNKELRKRIWLMEHGNGASAPRGHWAEGVAPAPALAKVARPEMDRAGVDEFVQGVPAIDGEFLRRRSPVDVRGMGPLGFLEALYERGEKVLIFLEQWSQGDFCGWKRDAGKVMTYRLAQQKGVTAVESALPKGGPEGVWFLTQPVSGLWAINPNSTKAGGEAKWSRRSEATVTDWRYFVLESDELPMELWLRVVGSLKLPIAAIYTSGKRSVHALVKQRVANKAQWDGVRDLLRPIVCPLGADPAALTAVRLSRLPGCLRGDRMQELMYLAPEPEHRPIWVLPEVRG